MPLNTTSSNRFNPSSHVLPSNGVENSVAYRVQIKQADQTGRAHRTDQEDQTEQLANTQTAKRHLEHAEHAAQEYPDQEQIEGRQAREQARLTQLDQSLKKERDKLDQLARSEDAEKEAIRLEGEKLQEKQLALIEQERRLQAQETRGQAAWAQQRKQEQRKLDAERIANQLREDELEQEQRRLDAQQRHQTQRVQKLDAQKAANQLKEKELEQKQSKLDAREAAYQGKGEEQEQKELVLAEQERGLQARQIKHKLAQEKAEQERERLQAPQQLQHGSQNDVAEGGQERQQRQYQPQPQPQPDTQGTPGSPRQGRETSNKGKQLGKAADGWEEEHEEPSCENKRETDATNVRNAVPTGGWPFTQIVLRKKKSGTPLPLAQVSQLSDEPEPERQGPVERTQDEHRVDGERLHSLSSYGLDQPQPDQSIDRTQPKRMAEDDHSAYMRKKSRLTLGPHQEDLAPLA
jgi:hypothetical protein